MANLQKDNVQLRRVGGVILAAVGGLLATVLVVLLFYRVGGLEEVAPPLVLTGAALQIASGQGEATPAGLVIRQPGANQLTSVQAAARMVRASIYRQLSWQVEGLEAGRPLRLIWNTLDQPDMVREMILPAVGPEGAKVDLSAQPHWRGRIAVMGLVVAGPLNQPLVVHRLELRPPALGMAELLRLAINEWKAFEDWSQRSINFTAGAPLDALFPPVLMVALWIGFSAACWTIAHPPQRGITPWWPYAAFFVVGWLVLDARWQWDLNQRLMQTATRFAGKEGEARELAGLDGEFYRFIREVRQHLPVRPERRVFIVSAKPSGFLAGRARYHLLPHNGFAGFFQPPHPGTARQGDHVLLLSPLSGVRYNRERRVLEWEGGQLAAERLYGGEAGALFRVMGE